jgi:hypothetical protein
MIDKLKQIQVVEFTIIIFIASNKPIVSPLQNISTFPTITSI